MSKIRLFITASAMLFATFAYSATVHQTKEFKFLETIATKDFKEAVVSFQTVKDDNCLYYGFLSNDESPYTMAVKQKAKDFSWSILIETRSCKHLNSGEFQELEKPYIIPIEKIGASQYTTGTKITAYEIESKDESLDQ